MKKLLLAFSALLGLVVCGSPLQAEAAMQAPTNSEPVSFYDKVIKMRFNVIDEDAATIAVAKRKTGDAGFLEASTMKETLHSLTKWSTMIKPIAW